jgi:hypothetical protein
VLLKAPSARWIGPGAAEIDLDAEEQAALAVLAGSGLIPPLRLVPSSAEEGEIGASDAHWAAGTPGFDHPDERPDEGRRTAV